MSTSSFAAWAIACKVAIILMLLTVIGVLSYPVYFADNEFRNQRDILIKDESTKGSIEDFQDSCKDLQSWIEENRNNSESEWYNNDNIANVGWDWAQLRACKDAVKLAKEFRKVVKRAELKKTSSFGLLCFALITSTISLIIQVAAGASYSKNLSKCCDSIFLVTGTLLVVAASGLLIYLGKFGCTNLNPTVDQMKRQEGEIREKLILINVELPRDFLQKLSVEWKEFNINSNPWYYTRPLVWKEETSRHMAKRKSLARLANCPKEYKTTMLGLLGGSGIIILIALIAAIALSAIIVPPPSAEGDSHQELMSNQKQLDSSSDIDVGFVNSNGDYINKKGKPIYGPDDGSFDPEQEQFIIVSPESQSQYSNY